MPDPSLGVYRYVVTVTCGSREQADRVMTERILHDEDYGFTYEIDWEWANK